MLWCLLAVSWATPDRPLARAHEDVRLSRYATVEGEGPAVARWRRRSGPVHAWTFRDRQVEHYVRFDGDAPVEAAWFSANGLRLATATFDDGVLTWFDPAVPDLAPVDVSSWTPIEVHGLWLRAPTPTSPGTWTTADGTVHVDVFDPGDPADPAYADAIGRGCGCRVLDRHTAWVDGRRGVRFLVELPDPDGPRRGEAWVLPIQDANLAVWAVWPEASPATWAQLRAMVSLATWEAP